MQGGQIDAYVRKRFCLMIVKDAGLPAAVAGCDSSSLFDGALLPA